MLSRRKVFLRLVHVQGVLQYLSIQDYTVGQLADAPDTTKKKAAHTLARPAWLSVSCPFLVLGACANPFAIIVI